VCFGYTPNCTCSLLQCHHLQANTHTHTHMICTHTQIMCTYTHIRTNDVHTHTYAHTAAGAVPGGEEEAAGGNRRRRAFVSIARLPAFGGQLALHWLHQVRTSTNQFEVLVYTCVLHVTFVCVCVCVARVFGCVRCARVCCMLHLCACV